MGAKNYFCLSNKIQPTHVRYQHVCFRTRLCRLRLGSPRLCGWQCHPQSLRSGNALGLRHSLRRQLHPSVLVVSPALRGGAFSSHRSSTTNKGVHHVCLVLVPVRTRPRRSCSCSSPGNLGNPAGPRRCSSASGLHLHRFVRSRQHGLRSWS